MEQLLNNPVYNALLSGDASLGFGNNTVKVFVEEVSPFAGFQENNESGFTELYNLLGAGRKILYATRNTISEPAGWQLTHHIQGMQFVFTGNPIVHIDAHNLVALQSNHVDEMIALARLTKPGPFNKRTIDFGHYNGIFENNKLVAMTGQRLHVHNYTEVSAVCTHPQHMGKGHAALLVRHQLNIICGTGDIPFLHVRADNERAIALYVGLGFTQNGAMHFYFLKRN